MRLMELAQDYNQFQGLVLTMSNLCTVLPEVHFCIIINEINDIHSSTVCC